MKRSVIGSVGAALLFGLLGCDGGGDLKEGVPENVDMTKNYTPAAALPTMDPKDQQKAGAKPTSLAPVVK